MTAKMKYKAETDAGSYEDFLDGLYGGHAKRMAAQKQAQPTPVKVEAPQTPTTPTVTGMPQLPAWSSQFDQLVAKASLGLVIDVDKRPSGTE
jgi:hypothetical protein